MADITDEIRNEIKSILTALAIQGERYSSLTNTLERYIVTNQRAQDATDKRISEIETLIRSHDKNISDIRVEVEGLRSRMSTWQTLQAGFTLLGSAIAAALGIRSN